MKKRKFDGSTKLEAALNILPAQNNIDEVIDGELLPNEFDDFELSDDQMDDDLVYDDGVADLVPVNNTSTDLALQTEIDEEIKDDIQKIYQAAMNAFEDANDDILSLEPKYVPRAMEVNKGYLDTALNAIALKQKQKEHSDKIKVQLSKNTGKSSGQTAGTINNNIIVSNHKDAMKLAKEMREKKKLDNKDKK